MDTDKVASLLGNESLTPVEVHRRVDAAQRRHPIQERIVEVFGVETTLRCKHNTYSDGSVLRDGVLHMIRAVGIISHRFDDG